MSKTSAPRAQPPGDVGRQRPAGGHVKRAIDVVLALLALVLLAPMFLLVAVLLRVGLGQPILVAERLVGFAGQVFTAYTFRTSSIHRERKLADDPTTANWLAFLRDSGVERLPLLLSIVRGHMSFVGPRPVALDELDRRGRFGYFAARPGLVGLRRADRAGRWNYRKCAALDRYYVRRWSVWLDLALLADTVVTIRDPTPWTDAFRPRKH